MHPSLITAANAYLSLGATQEGNIVRLYVARMLYAYGRYTTAVEHLTQLASSELADQARIGLDRMKGQFCADQATAKTQGWDGTPEALTALCQGAQ